MKIYIAFKPTKTAKHKLMEALEVYSAWNPSVDLNNDELYDVLFTKLTFTHEVRAFFNDEDDAYDYCNVDRNCYYMTLDKLQDARLIEELYRKL